MKRFLLPILLLVVVSCAPASVSQPLNTSTPTTMESATSNPILPIAPQTNPINTQTTNNVVLRAYDPAEWIPIYDKDTVWTIGFDQQEKIWITLGSGEVASFDGNKWVSFSQKDYGFADKPSDMAIAHDGTVWVSGRQAISRYRNGLWKVFPIPNLSTTAFTRLDIDPSGVIWVATPLCYCGNSIRKFNGTNWDELWLYTADKHPDASQLLFTPDGTLWSALLFPGGIGRYDGKTWKFYSRSDLGVPSSESGINIRIATDNRGNIYGIYEGQSWIVMINKDGSLSRILFDYSDLKLDSSLLRLFVDRENTIWINACLKNSSHGCLSYYKDGQWVSFVNLPFFTMNDFIELPDGRLLVATSQGLYQFKSNN